MQVRVTRRGARWIHDGHVLSEVLARPGPTHSIFDVLAAAAAVVTPWEEDIAMLGFAGGGLLAPLRAMGVTSAIHAVDLSVEAVPLFRELCGAWAGSVEVAEDDALKWLRRGSSKFQTIIEDLSAQIPNDVIKPEVSLTHLPKAMARRLVRGGAVVVNALPVKGYTRAELTHALTHPFAEVRSLSVEGFVNRILVAGSELPSARELSEQVSEQLASMGSTLANGCRAQKV